MYGTGRAKEKHSYLSVNKTSPGKLGSYSKCFKTFNYRKKLWTTVLELELEPEPG